MDMQNIKLLESFRICNQQYSMNHLVAEVHLAWLLWYWLASWRVTSPNCLTDKLGHIDKLRSAFSLVA